MPNSKITIEQIYNFVAEKKGMASKNQYMQLAIFFEQMHEGSPCTFIASKPFNYKGVYSGIEKTIYGHAAPEFKDKKNFINWVEKMIGDYQYSA